MKTLPLLERFNWHEFERVVILSPHLDDAALSCCGLLHALQERVSTLVVSISCGSLRVLAGDGSVNISARRGHVSPRIRRREDIAAMRSVNANFVHLGFADGIFRRSPLTGRLIYRNERKREPWVLPCVDDMAHIEELYLVLRRLCLDLGRVLLLSPMGIGHHVDHQIAAQVAVRLATAGAALLFYEDFPYVADARTGHGNHDGPHEALARLHLAATRHFSVPVDVNAKMALLRHYATQMSALFGDDKSMRERIVGHRHGNVPSEFYWQALATNPCTPKEKLHVE